MTPSTQIQVYFSCHCYESSFSIINQFLLDLTYFVWQDFLQSFSAQAAGLQLLLGLLCGLTLHQSFCLGQEVSQQNLQQHQTHTFSYSVVQCMFYSEYRSQSCNPVVSALYSNMLTHCLSDL